MTELRSLSKRAQITPTRMQNVYSYGDFGGDPEKLMERYFDVFVYVANWGTHRSMLRLPKRLLDPKAAWPYAVDGALDFSTKGDCIVLEFVSDDEEGGRWITDEEAAAWMPALLPLRAELAAGDQRALYLAWLAAVGAELLEDEDVEPPVPPGLGRLSASLETLADFLRVDEDLLAVAAERSPRLAERPGAGELERWIQAQPVADKDGG